MKNQTIEPSRSVGTFNVYKWSKYPSYSVLAGQDCKQYLDGFDSLEEAQAAYPEAEVIGHRVNPCNTFDHLEDEDGHLGPSPHDKEYGTDPQSQYERYD